MVLSKKHVYAIDTESIEISLRLTSLT